jgi:hypothetical protein
MNNRIGGYYEAQGYPADAGALHCQPEKTKHMKASGGAFSVSPDALRDVLRTNIKIAQLEMRIAELERIVRPSAAGPNESAEPKLAEVLEVTQKMFSGQPTIELACDPEEPDSKFVVITVTSKGNAREIVEQRLEWHERVARLEAGNSGQLRLSVIPSR